MTFPPQPPVVEQLRYALTQLSPRQIQAVELVYVERLSQRQVAARLRVSHETVRHDVATALQRIAAALERGEPAGRTTARQPETSGRHAAQAADRR